MTAPLLWIKLLHTVVWAFFAGCILMIPVAALFGRLQVAVVLVGVVAVEVVVLLVNRWTCPITPWAARHTDDRRPNFDIFLPQWLAEHNKALFGSLYGLGSLLVLVRWLGWF